MNDKPKTNEFSTTVNEKWLNFKKFLRVPFNSNFTCHWKIFLTWEKNRIVNDISCISYTDRNDSGVFAIRL